MDMPNIPKQEEKIDSSDPLTHDESRFIQAMIIDGFVQDRVDFCGIEIIFQTLTGEQQSDVYKDLRKFIDQSVESGSTPLTMEGNDKRLYYMLARGIVSYGSEPIGDTVESKLKWLNTRPDIFVSKLWEKYNEFSAKISECIDKAGQKDLVKKS